MYAFPRAVGGGRWAVVGGRRRDCAFMTEASWASRTGIGWLRATAQFVAAESAPAGSACTLVMA